MPSGVVIVTCVSEITSAGGTEFLAQSQNGWRRFSAALCQRKSRAS